MPTYEYECDACGHTFEKFQPITSRPVRLCPQCGKRKVRRLLGMGAGVIFKGSGFYQTDYRSESYKKGAEKEKSDAAGSDAKASGSDAKAAGSDARASGSEKKPPKDSSGGAKPDSTAGSEKAD